MKIRGSDLRVGDDLLGPGDSPHRVTSLERYDHPWPDLPPARIASSRDGWRMTVFHTDFVEVAS